MGPRRRRRDRGSPRPGRSPALPVAAVPRRRAARLRLRQPGPGADPADHADGRVRVRRHRRHGGAAVRPPRPARRPTRSRRRPPSRRSAARAFVDVTAVLRNRARAGGRHCASSASMEARTGAVLRDLFTDPAFAPVPGSRRRALRRVVPVLVRFRVPLVMLQASPPPRPPAAASRGCGAAGRRRSPPPTGRHARARARSTGRRRRSRPRLPGVPAQRPGLRGRLPHARGRAPARRARPGRRHDGRGAARAAAQRHHRDGPAAVGAGRSACARDPASAAVLRDR